MLRYMPRDYPQREDDPRKVKVQLNVKVTWEYREHLVKTAAQRGISINQLVNDALQMVVPMHKGFES